jgi:hypothetical protein
MTLDKDKVIAAVTALLQEMTQGQDVMEDMPAFVSQAVEADFAYMNREGLLLEDAEGFYDDDEAFDYIVQQIAAQGRLDEEDALAMAEMVNLYMEAMERYMDEEGLVNWQ